MTFGTPRWGSSDEVSETIFNAYVEAGGNFIDTADVYAGGRSEELVGHYIAPETYATSLCWQPSSGSTRTPARQSTRFSDFQFASTSNSDRMK